MKYAVVKVTDGNYNIHSEGHTSVDNARVSFYSLCQALLNDKDTQRACVMITDENLDVVCDGNEKYKTVISHVTPETQQS